MSEVIEKPTLRADVVNPNDLPKLWQELQPLIEEACRWSNGQFNALSVVNGVLDGALRLVVFFEKDKVQSAMVLTISEFPTQRRILEVLLASGTAMREWMKLEGELMTYAKANGCHAVRMIGREGLQKALTTWKRTAIVLEREID
jgi:hypothetical protein